MSVEWKEWGSRVFVYVCVIVIVCVCYLQLCQRAVAYKLYVVFCRLICEYRSVQKRSAEAVCVVCGTLSAAVRANRRSVFFTSSLHLLGTFICYLAAAAATSRLSRVGRVRNPLDSISANHPPTSRALLYLGRDGGNGRGGGDASYARICVIFEINYLFNVFLFCVCVGLCVSALHCTTTATGHVMWPRTPCVFSVCLRANEKQIRTANGHLSFSLSLCVMLLYTHMRAKCICAARTKCQVIYAATRRVCAHVLMSLLVVVVVLLVHRAGNLSVSRRTAAVRPLRAAAVAAMESLNGTAAAAVAAATNAGPMRNGGTESKSMDDVLLRKSGTHSRRRRRRRKKRASIYVHNITEVAALLRRTAVHSNERTYYYNRSCVQMHLIISHGRVRMRVALCNPFNTSYLLIC